MAATRTQCRHRAKRMNAHFGQAKMRCLGRRPLYRSARALSGPERGLSDPAIEPSLGLIGAQALSRPERTLSRS